LTKKCDKCELRYPKNEIDCTHCSDLSNQEVEELKAKYEDEHYGNTRLGRIFMVISILLLVGMLMVGFGSKNIHSSQLSVTVTKGAA
jgi:hypothetical protein